jgi:predicted negative regulator of RcsB-dependent stress response
MSHAWCSVVGPPTRCIESIQAASATLMPLLRKPEMAIDDLDEHEQGERVRKWLRQNGGSIVLGIGAGILALGGWQYWQQAKRDRTQAAQVEYQALLDAETRNDAEAVAKSAGILRGEYAKTPYGVFAALGQARDAVRKGDLAAAEDALQWARGVKLDLPALNELVVVRLAQVKLAKGDAQAVLDLLGGAVSQGYKGLAAELRGDAYVALGRPDDARLAYEDALGALDAGSPQHGFVEMKHGDLAVAAPVAAAPAAAPVAPAAPAAPAPIAPPAAEPAKASS